MAIALRAPPFRGHRNEREGSERGAIPLYLLHELRGTNNAPNRCRLLLWMLDSGSRVISRRRAHSGRRVRGQHVRAATKMRAHLPLVDLERAPTERVFSCLADFRNRSGVYQRNSPLDKIKDERRSPASYTKASPSFLSLHRRHDPKDLIPSACQVPDARA